LDLFLLQPFNFLRIAGIGHTSFLSKLVTSPKRIVLDIIHIYFSKIIWANLGIGTPLPFSALSPAEHSGSELAEQIFLH
jgi:hypothetical protein